MTRRDRAGTRRTRRAGARATTVRVCASPTAPSSTVPDPADQRERRRCRRRRAEPGVAPRRPEAVEHVADARPVRRRCRWPGSRRVMSATRPDHHQHEEPEERDRRRRAHAVGHGVDRAPRRVAERAQPGVGVQVVGEERAEPRGARHLQLAQLGVVHRAQRWARRRDARRRRTWNRFENQLPIAARARRGRPVSRSPTASTKPTTNPIGHQPQQLAQRVRREQHPHARPRERELVGPVVAQAVGRPPHGAVARASGTTQHACAGEARPPAEVEVFGAGEGRGIEAPELREQVGAHEHHRGGDVEDVAHAVVLLLVDLAGLDAGVRRAEAVDGAAHLEQDLGVLGAHQLGPEDAGVGAVPLLDQEPHRGRVEHDVVVAEQRGRSRPRPRGGPRWRRRRSRRRRRAGGRTPAGAPSATRAVGSSCEPQSTTSTVRSS